MALISSLKALTLDLPPSCVAFCPSRPQYFVVGTYFLHPKEQEGAGVNNSDGGVAESDARHNSIQQEAERERRDGKQLRTGSLILFRLNAGDEVM